MRLSTGDEARQDSMEIVGVSCVAWGGGTHSGLISATLVNRTLYTFGSIPGSSKLTVNYGSEPRS